MALYSFIILLLTGIYLALFFDPSITKVIYDAVQRGVRTVVDDLRDGWLFTASSSCC